MNIAVRGRNQEKADYLNLDCCKLWHFFYLYQSAMLGTRFEFGASETIGFLNSLITGNRQRKNIKNDLRYRCLRNLDSEGGR